MAYVSFETPPEDEVYVHFPIFLFAFSKLLHQCVLGVAY